MKMFQFKISLAYIKPAIWRRFVIPSDATFGDLSNTIQIVMGWTNSHLHEFYVGQERIGMKDEDSPDDVKNENRIRLATKLKTAKSRFRYVYDFGDDWEHFIVLEKILNDDEGSPRCLAGKRNCPPEDCGGPYQYMEILTLRNNPKDSRPEMQELLEWFDPKVDPECFNLDEVNSMLGWKQ
jgi:hypothetical protein